jgi:AraC-like DNA-binding protein
MSTHEFHTCGILSSPLCGVFGTDVHSTRHYDRHWHTTFGVGLMERGAHRSSSGRGIVEARAGDVITTNPGEVHDGKPLRVRSRRWRMIYLEAPTMAALATDLGSDDVRLTQPVIHDAGLALVVRQALRRLEGWSDATTRSAAIALSFEEALVRACEKLRVYSTSKTSSGGAVDADVERIRERLADDLVDTPSLSLLAAMVGLSRFQLLRRFEQRYGLTPFQWQRQVRTEHARSLIARGKSLANAAHECGFSDQSHLTRVFLAHYGFTPGEWRRTARSGRCVSP